MIRTFPVVLVSLLLATGCTSSNPSSPGSLSASVTVPSLLTPANLAQIANNAQPVTLVVRNAVVTQSVGTTYGFEVATDAAFTNKVQTKSGVAEGSGGQTSLTLATLPAGAIYYWHAQATAGGTTGTFGTALQFTIGPAITISAPTPVSPANGATTIPTQPTLIVNNSARTDPNGVIAYRFDISTNANFTIIVASGSVGEGAGQTSYQPNATLAVATTYYWRAVAIDQVNLVTSAASATESFTTVAFPGVAAGIAAKLGQVLWPGAVPSGVNGQAVLGNSCDGSPNWGIATCYSPFAGVYFQAPTIEALRYFDLFDRGYDPQSAINWMMSNGYPTIAQWYPPPQKAVLGLGYFYLAARGQVVGPGTIWDIVTGLG
jgi:hypothetical protein